MRTIAARPTTYRGVSMRSRLEATVAAELDRRQWTWIYEPRAYASPLGQYLPDFQITGDEQGPYDFLAFMEVRPTLELGLLATEQMQIILASEPDAMLFVDIYPIGVCLYSTRLNRVWRQDR